MNQRKKMYQSGGGGDDDACACLTFSCLSCVWKRTWGEGTDRVWKNDLLFHLLKNQKSPRYPCDGDVCDPYDAYDDGDDAYDGGGAFHHLLIFLNVFQTLHVVLQHE